LIGERYERTATIVTSNLDYNEWGESFPNKLLGASTLDRLRHAAYRLTLDGESYRAPRAETRSQKSTRANGLRNAK
jgi:DNA replication protein DnaC